MRPLIAVILTSIMLLAACAPAPAAATSTTAPVAQSGASASAASSAPASGAVNAPGGFTVRKPPAGATAGPDVDMIGYRNPTVGFSLHFALVWQTDDASANPVVYKIAVQPGTTLVDKHFEILTTPNATDCKQSTYSSATGDTAPTHVTINSVDFLKETGSDVGAGNIRDWTSYSVMKDTTCITITFVLHSVAAGVYSTEPAPFDKAQESQIFDDVIGTFELDQ